MTKVSFPYRYPIYVHEARHPRNKIFRSAVVIRQTQIEVEEAIADKIAALRSRVKEVPVPDVDIVPWNTSWRSCLNAIGGSASSETCPVAT